MLTDFINEAARAMQQIDREKIRTDAAREAGRVTIRVNKRTATPAVGAEDRNFYERARAIYSRARRTHMTRAAAIF